MALNLPGNEDLWSMGLARGLVGLETKSGKRPTLADWGRRYWVGLSVREMWRLHRVLENGADDSILSSRTYIPDPREQSSEWTTSSGLGDGCLRDCAVGFLGPLSFVPCPLRIGVIHWVAKTILRVERAWRKRLCLLETTGLLNLGEAWLSFSVKIITYLSFTYSFICQTSIGQILYPKCQNHHVV